jgi:hypothetical protein
MRQAAGIMLMILGALMLVACVVVLIDYDINVHDPVLDISFMFFGGYLVSGGVFCLKKKYLELCLGSAFIAVFTTIGSWIGSYSLTWIDWIHCILGILPIVFVCLRRREWSESRA